MIWKFYFVFVFLNCWTLGKNSKNLWSSGLCVLVAQSCPTGYNLMDCRPPGSYIYGIFPGKNTGVGCHFFLQEILPTQESNQGLPHCRQTLLSEPRGRLWPDAFGRRLYLFLHQLVNVKILTWGFWPEAAPILSAQSVKIFPGWDRLWGPAASLLKLKRAHLIKSDKHSTHPAILSVNRMKRQKDRTLKDELPRSVGAQYATGDQWRNNSRKN